MRIVVTGSAGFIGSHLCRYLSSQHTLIGWDRHNRPSEDLLLQPQAFTELLDNTKPDAVIHLAAKVGRLFGEDDLRRTIDDNAGMTTLVARACGERGIKLLYASTSEVYGDRGEHLCLEDEPFQGVPHNLYGLSKRWGEEACKLYAPDNLVIMRFSMPYGPGLPAGRGRAALINFLYNAIHGLPIQVHRDSERSWCYIQDTVRAVGLILNRGRSGAYNIGRDDNALPMLEVAQLCCDVVGAPRSLIQEIDAPGRQTVVKRLSTDKIRSLGWKPNVSFQEGLERTLTWVMDLPAGQSRVA